VYFFLSKILAPLINLTNLILLLCIISYFLKKFFFKKILTILNYLTIFLIIVIGIMPIGKTLVYTLEKDYFNQKTLKDYSYIIVLGGSEDIYTTSITNKLNLNSASERLIASVKLANKKKDSKIIYLGGNGFLSKENLNEADVAKIFYKDVSFDIERVIFIDNTRNTIENLKQLKKLNLKVENNSILITSAFHMKRAQLISKKLHLNLTPYAVDFRSFNSLPRVGLINYYQTFSFASNLGYVNLYFREFLGLISVYFLM
jgi:uncharacterized SAM-binding protein YcdF (DUF218 family)